jgi:hypothetical protein
MYLFKIHILIHLNDVSVLYMYKRKFKKILTDRLHTHKYLHLINTLSKQDFRNSEKFCKINLGRFITTCSLLPLMLFFI